MNRRHRRRSSPWMAALVLLVGVPALLLVIGLVSAFVTGLALFAGLLSDLTNGY